MYRRASLLLVAALACVVFFGQFASAQALLQPTPVPLVTAEHESWYLNGEPISHAGHLYYPAGAQVFFNPNEMVRSGFHMGVPLYSRPTLEPFSLVYVPLAGGRMQPYERLRSGELVGTAGSQPASIITPYDPRSAADLMPQAAGEPSRAPMLSVPGPIAPPDTRTEQREPAPSVGTSGRAAIAPQHVRIGPRPQGINAIFVDYEDVRWYSTGRVVPVDEERMVRSGDFRGFPVWKPRDGSRNLLYFATTPEGAVVVPYSRQRGSEVLGFQGFQRFQGSGFWVPGSRFQVLSSKVQV